MQGGQEGIDNGNEYVEGREYVRGREFMRFNTSCVGVGMKWG